MSKVQSSVRKYVAEFGENIFASDGGILFCKVCEIKVNSVKHFTVTQHLKTDKHIRAVNRKIENKSKSQQLLPNIPEKSMFAKDLCNTFLLANIPLEKLENKHVRLFLEKYTSKDIPSVSLLRKKYVNECYEDTMNNIRNQLGGRFLKELVHRRLTQDLRMGQKSDQGIKLLAGN
ncbi:CGG triplet repeat-binding protein 1-like [Melanaphis sacchari]|uniref:CGG triplet repeat-binding protein 1-like n=1 Tax=Melanaphis sacchari TaxID=742174 RepID=UPI000DC145CD|nr:CGG triplet repeat-binding protein 1-like [Melanaphis sacchari]